MVESNEDRIRSKGIYLLPNLFTLAALFFGFYAIIAAFKGFYASSAMTIFIAMLLDSLDGRVARLTQTMTPFGAQFDSLSDIISFGIAPAVLAYSWALYGLGKIGWLAVFLYVAAVALRLARFNTQLGENDSHYFYGLACTPAAGVLAGLVWIGSQTVSLINYSGFIMAVITALVSVLLAVLMVSNVRYRSFKEFDLRKHVSFVVILVVILLIVLLTIDPPRFLFAVFALYALYGPSEMLWEMHRKKALKKAKAKKEKKKEKKK